jgi:hypothetical protein
MASGIGLIASVVAGLSNPHQALVTLRQHLHRDSSDKITTESMDSFPANRRTGGQCLHGGCHVTVGDQTHRKRAVDSSV